MESKVKRLWRSAMVLLLSMILPVPFGSTQENARQADETGTAEISLRKTVGAREYKGKIIEGDEREVRSGDTLWHILVREKGYDGERFKEYFVLIRGLNPQVKTPETLNVGDKIFIPLRPNEALALQGASELAQSADRVAPGQGKIQQYVVKPGDHLYQILRQQLGVSEDRKLWQYFALVKHLNPQKNNWDVIEMGETIRLPVVGGEYEKGTLASKAAPALSRAASGAEPARAQTQMAMLPPAAPKAVAPPVIGLDYAQKLSARENFALIGLVAESLGNQVYHSGEEVVALQDGAIRLDKNRFPVVHNPALDQRVILDGEDNIPESVRANLKQTSVNTPVVSMAKNTTVQEAVGQLLARLGYQPLPAERPVVVHDGGVAFEAKGQWAVMAPEQSNKPQEIIVINLADGSGEIPEELRTHLAQKGLHLKNVAFGEAAARAEESEKQAPLPPARRIKALPAEKSELVDSLLNAYQVPFGVQDTLAVELHSGLKAEISADRTFELRGRKTALFFRAVDPAIKAALDSKQGVKAVELDFTALKSREIVAKLLGELGEEAAYREHRFAAAKGSLQDRLVMTAAGFLLPGRSLFVTDREIPARFQPIFFEKGLDIVYFQ
ncbi:MAG TPA: LysM peptidoglycan-binding domain-containing protein [Candidatus Binatia bacterium]|jgi:hypothetical protein